MRCKLAINKTYELHVCKNRKKIECVTTMLKYKKIFSHVNTFYSFHPVEKIRQLIIIILCYVLNFFQFSDNLSVES